MTQATQSQQQPNHASKVNGASNGASNGTSNGTSKFLSNRSTNGTTNGVHKPQDEKKQAMQADISHSIWAKIEKLKAGGKVLLNGSDLDIASVIAVAKYVHHF